MSQPAAVPVFDVVEHDGTPCLVLQHCPSPSLVELLTEQGRMPVAEVARIGGEGRLGPGGRPPGRHRAR
ncbi:MAG TPA: hypothetical protein VES93_04550 [Ornithinibacter sp.]|nr:hypothetical protein [Ornithinibacter sp.]